MSLFAKKATETEIADGLGGLSAAATPAAVISEAPAAQAAKIPTPPELLTPDAQAATNAMVSAAVREAVGEAVKAVFAGIAPVLKDLALTPEKLAQLKAPYQDPKLLARELRESQKSKADEEENRKNTRLRQEKCMHIDQNGKSALGLIHNYPDRQPRGICPLCHDIINPKEWVFGAPDPVTGKSVATIRPAHKDYKIVLQRESMS